MKYENKLAYRTKADLKIIWRNFWNLTIPKGTKVHFTAQGGFHCAAATHFILDDDIWMMNSKHDSMFAHDRDHYWIWIDHDFVEQVLK
jgi:hypothetical protein